MNEIILQILPKIVEVVRVLTNDPDEQHDLQQEVILKCYANEGKIRRLVVETGLSNWLFITAKNIRTNALVKAKTEQNHRPHIQYAFSNQPQEDPVKEIEALIQSLKGNEKMWIELYLKHGLNYSQIERKAKIERRIAKRHISPILERWKNSRQL